MADYTICVGTIGSGVWYSSDSGEHWRQAKMDVPFEAQPGEIQIRQITSAASDPRILLAGSEVGLYRSEDAGASWSVVNSPFAGRQIWSVAMHPEDPDTIFVGTKPPALHRSRDGGESWEELPLDPADECLAGPPKVTCIVFDPRDSDTLWVGVEIDGIYRSTDGGDSWAQVGKRGDSPFNDDIHCVAVTREEPARVLACTPDGLWTSMDDGDTWSLQEFPRFFENRGISYCRGIAVKTDDPKVTLVANGNMIPGRTGAVRRSSDGGQSWEAADLSDEPNSTMYWFATHPADPDFIVANSLFGYVYVSRDAGQSWQKIEREFGEARGLAWVPTPGSD